MQFHSTPLSEPPAILGGSFVCGLIGYLSAGLFTHDHNAKLWTAMTFSVLANVLIGAPINLATLDLLGLCVARPVSALAGAKILSLVLNA